MYWLAEICVKRPVFALMLIVALVVAGIVAFPQLGVDRFPSMDLPTIYVRTTYPGAAAQEVESEVSSVIEDAVATVAGIDELRSISSDGRSFVLVTFDLDRDIDAATQDVRDAVAGVLNRRAMLEEFERLRRKLWLSPEDAVEEPAAGLGGALGPHERLRHQQDGLRRTPLRLGRLRCAASGRH